MSAGTSRGWMNRRMHDGYLSDEFCNGVDSFLDCAFSNVLDVERYSIDGRTVLRIRCPCKKCAHRNHKTRQEVELDLMQFGFITDSTSQEPTEHLQQSSNLIECDEVDGCTQMVLDNMAPRLSNTWQEQEPNPQAKRFYEMLEAADQPLWDGFDKCSQLQAAARFLNLKAECNIPDTTYNRILSMIKETLLPEGERLVGSLYETKNMLKPLWLSKERIHACKNHCMLFHKENADYTSCRVCGEPRYKKNGNRVPNLVLTYLPVAPRLQRLYMCAKTAKEMTWHHNHQTEEGKMAHPSDGKAWKHFNMRHPDFAQEIRNVRLGLCTDGFNPNISSSNPYSLWPVFVTNYNLPPWMGLKECYIHLALVIPGRKSPGQNLDVFLRPLIDKLKMLYNEGVTTYDASQRTNFTMRAILLWTVSDFPAYAMLSGWSTHGKLACPYCMDKVDSFQLQSGGKSCWFDCHRKFLRSGHPFRRDKVRFRARNIVKVRKPPELTGYDIWEQVRHLPTVYDGVPYKPQNRKPLGFGETHNWVKRSIFWELPYWKTLLFRHNLDVMHIEKNVFDNLFHTIRDTSKTKDNVKAREDIEHYCNRPELHMVHSHTRVLKPKASYTLSRRQVHTICEWLKELRFPDNYASNIGGCVNIKDGSFYGFKSHDCHIFMQRLLPIAIRGMVPNPIWDAITELCTFFRVICSRVLHMVDLIRLKDSIVETICKLERIFPPGFFDSMEHLVIHLADEAILGGPVQYRWMYLYERRLGSLKRTVRIKRGSKGRLLSHIW